MKIDAYQNLFPAAMASQPKPNDPIVLDQEIVTAVHALNKAELAGEGREFTFGTDKDSGRQVIRIMDSKTKKVVRQIPPETVIRLAEEIGRFQDSWRDAEKH